MRFWKRRDPRAAAAQLAGAVSFDDQRITRELGGGRSESIRWVELSEVRLVTTDGGPFADDVVWVLVGGDRGILVPSETPGTGALLERLQELPGFDSMAVIEAMGSITNNSFLCWRSDPA
ncbi:hypothetical protein [Gordonia crocea]|uniref:Uncharacterized protein n=1 Tax=Gordonia crocea TaxID=589162 RepID=A0A7M3SUS5_9ACTN|nr:hypothetical protein [Gordonia crocea]GED96399.1 hypothetical protein nbrc107697_04380 [Gordonia crocea]